MACGACAAGWGCSLQIWRSSRCRGATGAGSALRGPALCITPRAGALRSVLASRAHSFHAACPQSSRDYGVCCLPSAPGPGHLPARSPPAPHPPRLLWQAYTRPAWSKAAHQAFHPAFRAATREFLLVARCGENKRRQERAAAAAEQAAGLGRRSCGGGSRRCSAAGCRPGCAGCSEVALAALGRLPEEVLLQIVAATAYPLSSWVRGA